MSDQLPEIQAKKDNSPALPRSSRDLKKTAIISLVVLGIFFTGSVLAYQNFKKKILACGTPGAEGICFELMEDGRAGVQKVSVKKLDPNKKYQLVINRKIGDKVVEIGSVEVDMQKIGSDAPDASCLGRQQGSDRSDAKCCDDLQLKTDLWNDASWKYFSCCQPDECAQDGICVASGQSFPEWRKKCQNGQWLDYSPESSDFCTDSDGGKNYEQKGQVIHNNIVKEDECETEEGTILIEYFCDNGRLAKDIVECSGGLCRDGACVYDFVRDCTDSDKGIDIYNKGTLNWSVQGFVTSDECSNSTTLKEYFCVGTGPSSSYQLMLYNCPNGCADGACNKPEPGTKASGECKAAGEFVYADPLISYRQMLLGFNCCAGLVGKVDYFAKNDWSGVTCCLPSQCALDTACFNEGPSGVFGVDGTEPACKNGSW